MRARVASATRRFPEIACETVVMLTPACRATSTMVTPLIVWVAPD